MKIDFNELRIQAMEAMDSLTDKLNNRIVTEENAFNEGDIVVSPKEIQSNMDDLRSLISAIAACYNDDEIVDVHNQRSKPMIRFNDN